MNPDSPTDAAPETAATNRTSEPIEKPENGLAGLKHWRHDLLAGVVVSLVSLPLSSGIAIASGAPPIYGLISAVLAGLIYPALGGSYVTISGPAAGLAPALVAIQVGLGGAGDAGAVGLGYPKLLVVIFFVGICQIVMAKLRLAKYAAVFPASVVEGMLAAIGVLILVKAVPLTLGVVDPGHPHGFLEYVRSVPGWVRAACLPASAVGLVTLVVLFVTSSKRAKAYRLFRVVPPHLWGVAAAVPMSLALGLKAIDPRLLISVPSNPLAGVTLPAFSAVFGDPATWSAAALGLVTLFLIDGAESLATAQAIDRVDPFKRTSDPDRVILAMGVSNLASSLVGGLTVIPGGVKSKTNIEAGGRTLWSNFVNAMMLLLFLFVAPGFISMIPTAALGAILIYTGWKMAHPTIGIHIAKIGPEQLALFAFTLVTTLLTDLLVGVALGTACKLVLLVHLVRRVERAGGEGRGLWSMARSFFGDPVAESYTRDGVATLEIVGPVTCFNAYWLRDHLRGLDEAVREVEVILTPGAVVCDHTGSEALLAGETLVGDRGYTLRGFAEMEVLGREASSIHLASRAPAAPRSEGPPAQPIRKILCAVDLAATSRGAALEAARLAGQLERASLLFLTVASPGMAATSDGPIEEPPGAGAREARPLLQEWLGDLPGLTGPVDIRAAEGEPAEAILEVAAREDADWIVLGTAGRTGVGRVILGSVAERVVRESRRPVLVVRGDSR